MKLDNPVAALLPKLAIELPGARPQDPAQAQLWDALHSLTRYVKALVELGEYHTVTVTASGLQFAHGLKRKPFGYELIYRDGARNLVDDKEKWTADRMYLQTSAGSMTVTIRLF